MKRALALAAVLLLAGCEAELDHMFKYDDVRRSPDATVVASPVAERPVAATAPPAAIATSPTAIVTPPGAIAPIAAAPVPVESPGTAFCRSVALGDSNAGAFDDATRRAAYARSLAQCMAIHGN